MNHVTLTGEMFVGQESCASRAISTLITQLEGQTAQLNDFFRPVGLTIKNWHAGNVERVEDGFYVTVEATADAQSQPTDLMDFINTHHKTLYFDKGGYVPEMVA